MWFITTLISSLFFLLTHTNAQLPAIPLIPNLVIPPKINMTQTNLIYNATENLTRNIIQDIGKLLESLGTLPPNPLGDLFGNLGAPIDLNKLLEVLSSLPPLPTLDPNFFANLPTLPPLPTLDPDFFKNLPTLPPLPTLDPNFFKGLPTFAPLDLSGSNLFGNSDKNCIPQLLKFVRDNETISGDLRVLAEEAKVVDAINTTVQQASNICGETASTALRKFVDKHMETFKLMEKVSPNFTTEERLKIFNWLITDNRMALSAFVAEKGMKNIFNPALNMELMNISLRLSGMQMELMFQPI